MCIGKKRTARLFIRGRIYTLDNLYKHNNNIAQFIIFSRAYIRIESQEKKKLIVMPLSREIMVQILTIQTEFCSTWLYELCLQY